MMAKKFAYAAAVITGATLFFLSSYYVYEKFRISRTPESNLFSMGQVAASKGDYNKAIEYYQALLRKDPRHEIALDFLIDSQIRANDLQGAIASSETLLKMSPSQKYYQRLVELYQKVGMTDKAVALQKSRAESADQPAEPSKNQDQD
jgi:tetratricopeptide (TPR) repeat protein